MTERELLTDSRIKRAQQTEMQQATPSLILVDCLKCLIQTIIHIRKKSKQHHCQLQLQRVTCHRLVQKIGDKLQQKPELI